MTEEFYVDFMLPEERPIIESWKKLDVVVQDFVYIWYRNRSWEEAPPVMIYNGDEPIGNPVGFHGVKFTKSGYINSVFQFILPEYRGQRLGGLMVDFFLKEGVAKGMTRLRMRCPKTDEGWSDGDAFWRGFGLVPYGKTEKEYFYDLSLKNVNCLGDLMQHARWLCEFLPTDKRILGLYKRLGVEVL